MISVEQAKELIIKHVTSLPKMEVQVTNALGFVMAENIIAPISVPSFNQSAMDGYAFKYDDCGQPLRIVNEVAAGELKTVEIKQGEAVRIFTGAKVPDTCDTVVMQELTEVQDDLVIVMDEGLKKGGNIRSKGSQIEQGKVALNEGTEITPAAIGFLSALGLTNVKVYQKPRVTIIATGNELIKPGEELMEGQIFESNTWMLKSALDQLKIDSTIIQVEDDQHLTQNAIGQALSLSELLLLSGGISVGDYDFVKISLQNLEVKEVFYKVKQKPGKPLYFGKTESCYVFALPGNPAAALTCFYQYVYAAINLMQNKYNCFLPQLNLPITKKLIKKEGRAVFYKAHTDYNKVETLEGQGSDILRSFALANCFIYIPDEVGEIAENELVEVHLLP